MTTTEDLKRDNEGGVIEAEEAKSPAQAGADTGDSTGDTPAPAKRASLPARPITLILATALVAAVAAGVTGWLLFLDKADGDSARTAALNTARSYAATLTTYDHNTMDASIANVLDGATGEFKRQYSGASATLKKMISETKATVEGTVIAAGVSSASDDKTEVLLFVDQTVQNGKEKPRTDRNRIELTLERHDSDRWLVSQVQIR